MSISAWFHRTAALVGLVSLLGAGACGSVGVEVSPDALIQVSPDAPAPDGAPIPTISVRGSKTAIGVRTSSLMIQRPDEVAAGDVLLAHISKRNDVESEVTLAGWEWIREDESDALLNSWLLWKAAGDDEPDVYAFEISGTADNSAGIIVAVVGADPMDPIDAADGKRTGRSKEFPGRAQDFVTRCSTGDAATRRGRAAGALGRQLSVRPDQHRPGGGAPPGRRVDRRRGSRRIDSRALTVRVRGAAAGLSRFALRDLERQHALEGLAEGAATARGDASGLAVMQQRVDWARAEELLDRQALGALPNPHAPVPAFIVATKADLIRVRFPYPQEHRLCLGP